MIIIIPLFLSCWVGELYLTLSWTESKTSLLIWRVSIHEYISTTWDVLKKIICYNYYTLKTHLIMNWTTFRLICDTLSFNYVIIKVYKVQTIKYLGKTSPFYLMCIRSFKLDNNSGLVILLYISIIFGVRSCMTLWRLLEILLNKINMYIYLLYFYFFLNILIVICRKI